MQTYGIATEEVLDSGKIQEPFTRKFFTQARRPRFDFIAPGLRILRDADLSKQPLKDIQVPEPHASSMYMRVLCFEGVGDGKTSITAVEPFGWPWNENDLPPGFYLLGSREWPHCGTLKLPFHVGANS